MRKTISTLRILIVLVASMLTSVCLAAPRSKAAMQAIASGMMQSLRQTAMSQNMSQTMQARPVMRAAATSRQIVSATAEADDYVVYVPEQGTGFVIVSTDDRQPEVLAFSDSETFDATSVPDGLKAMLEAYTILANDNDPDALSRIATSYSTVKNVEPLIKEIAFNQGAPYNKKCPVINGKATYAGCVATSMSQIMAHYRYPAKATGGTVSYTTSTHKVQVTWNMDATTFDWNNILPVYTAECKPYTGSETTSTSELMKYESAAWAEDSNNTIVISNFKHATSEDLTSTVQFILTDKSGKMIAPVGNPKEMELAANRYYPTYKMTVTVPSDLADGDYKLYVGVRKSGTTTWNLSKKTSGSSLVDGAISVKKQGNKFCIDDKWVACGYTSVNADAVATLHAAAGAAVNMDYAPDGSGATYVSMMKAMNTNFGYDDGITAVPAACVTSGEMNDIVSKALSDGTPLSCSGHTETGSGHSYLIDGCKVEDGNFYVHINWGYSGTANGYFLLANMDPSLNSSLTSRNYSYRYYIIKGFKPVDDVVATSQFSMEKLTTDKTSYEAGESIAVTYKNVFNRSIPTFAGTIYLVALDDEAGKAYKVNSLFKYSGCKLNSGSSGSTRTTTIPASMPAGTYRLTFYTLPDTETSLSKATRMYCADLPTITITSATGISDMPTADGNLGDEAVRTYNVAGQKVNRNAKGIVIERRNGTAVKRVMR